ncbi:MAG: 3-oxoacyl-ACP reductase FabG [Myxococcota bacterium]
MSDFDLTGRVALVTGGSRGIGRAVCERLATHGADVALTYTNSEEGAKACLEAIIKAGGKGSIHPLDVRDNAAIEGLVEQLMHDRGQIDILVNNAGIVRDTLLLTMSNEDWLEVIDTNLSGAARCLKAVGMHMMLQRRGAIVNLSSVSAGHPNRGQANYAASKGGIEAFTRAMAVELGRKNIRVNAVAPGVIVTDMSARIRDEAGSDIKKRTLLRKLGQPEQVAAAVHFLVSDASSYITGQVLAVDGGLGLG